LKTSRIFALLLLLAISLAVTFKDYNEGGDRHHRMIAFLSEAKDIDRSIDEDILLTRSFLLSNYDSLVRKTGAASRVCDELIKGPAPLDSPSEELGRAIASYCEAVRSKNEAVEEFKSVNSVLRNARAYIPTLVDRFQGTPFDERADHLMIYILRHFIEQTPESRRAVEGSLAWTKEAERDSHLEEAAVSLKAAVSRLLEAFSNRVRLESVLFSNETKLRHSGLEVAYFHSYSRTEKRNAVLRTALLMLSAALASALVFFVYRVHQATDALGNLNRTLEQKVEDRTGELRRALQRLAENQQILAQAAKMSALGEMAGGIAHEINTPLAAILLLSESLGKIAGRLGEGELASGLQEISKTVQRISRIVTGLRRFSRDSSGEPLTPKPVAEIIEDTLMFCREFMKNHGIRLDVNLEVPGLVVECVPEQVSQVLLNLLNNACDAVVELPERWIIIGVAQTGGSVEISVTDSGTGISPGIRAKLMQPFFTTKEIGKGTGLGLSISKGLIESHGGTLVLDGDSLHTRFVVQLRLYDEYRIA